MQGSARFLQMKDQKLHLATVSVELHVQSDVDRNAVEFRLENGVACQEYLAAATSAAKEFLDLLNQQSLLKDGCKVTIVSLWAQMTDDPQDEAIRCATSQAIWRALFPNRKPLSFQHDGEWKVILPPIGE